MNYAQGACSLEEIGLPRSTMVLITGGAGFIGTNLVNKMLAYNARVRVIDDFSTGSPDRLPKSSQLEVIQGSILDKAILKRSTIGVDLIIHLASVVGMRRVQRDPDYAFSLSDLGTKLVLEASGDIPVLLMSSSSVYGLKSHDIAVESALVDWQAGLDYDGGRPGYACGKLKLEEHGFSAMAKGRNVIIARPFNVVGPGQLSEYGMVLPGFVQMASAGKVLTVYDDGMQTRSFSHVITFTDCILKLLCTPNAWAINSNPINVGAPQETQISDLARIVIEATQSKSSIQFIPFREAYPGKLDVRRRIPATCRLTSLIGHVDWPDMRIIVQDFIDAYQA